MGTAVDAPADGPAPSAHSDTRLGLLIPGQGAQRPRMAAGLYEQDPAFTDAMDHVFDLAPGGTTLRDLWLSPNASDDAVDDGESAQPLLFAVGHALGAMVRSWGFEPDAMLGQSVGEVSAAALAGVFSPGEIAFRTAARSQALTTCAPGGMVVVAESAEAVTPFLAAGAVIGAVNMPRQCVVSGADGALTATIEQLAEQDVATLRVRARQPFHSPEMARAVEMLHAEFVTMDLQAPRLPIFSTHTGRLLETSQARDPWFWARQVMDPILIWPALESLFADLAGAPTFLLELGIGQSLSRLARRHPAVRSGLVRLTGLLPDDAGADEWDHVRRVRDELAALQVAALDRPT